MSADGDFDLHRLSNKDLVERIRNTLKEAAETYAAQFREQAMLEAYLGDAIPQERGDKEAKKAAKDADPMRSSLDKARSAMTQARQEHDKALSKIETLQKEKGMWNRLGQSVETSHSASLAYLKTLAGLKPYMVELGLRIKDGTLNAKELGPLPTEESLAKLRDSVNLDLDKLRKQAGTIRESEVQANQRLDAARHDATHKEAQLHQIRRRLKLELTRSEVEKGLEGKKSPDLIKELTHELEQGSEAKRRFDLAYAAFNSQEEAVAKFREKLAAIRQPEGQIGQVSRIEDIDPAIESLRQLITFCVQRNSAFDEATRLLAVLTEQGRKVEAEAVVSMDVLFKLQVLVAVITKLDDPTVTLPPSTAADKLAAASQRIDDAIGKVYLALNRANQDSNQIKKQRLETNLSLVETQNRLASLQKARQATTAAEASYEAARPLTTEAFLAAFEQWSGEIKPMLVRLATDRNNFAAARDAAERARVRLDTIKNPFVRLAEQQSQGIKEKFREELAREGGLDRMTSARPISLSSPGSAAPTKPEKANTPLSKDEPSNDELPFRSLVEFEDLVATRAHVLEEREVRRKELATATVALEASLETFFAARK